MIHFTLPEPGALRAIYLSGPMTGKEAYNAAAFEYYKHNWEGQGWRVVTPLDTNSIVWRRHYLKDFDPYTDHCDYGDPLLAEMFVEDVRALVEAKNIGLLPGWRDSRGANMELGIARLLGFPVWDAETMEPFVEESVCQEADRIVSGDRGAAYGHPFDDYTRTGAIWGGVLHGWAKQAAASAEPVAVPPDLAVLCMIGVKMSREVHAPKRDNRVDMNGYAKCLDMIRERQATHA